MAVTQDLKFIAQLYGSDEVESPELLQFSKWKLLLLNSSLNAISILQRLPPTQPAIIENILRAHLQVAYWLAAVTFKQPCVDVEKFIWEKDELNKCLTPITLPKDITYVPEFVINYTKCGCKAEVSCKNSRWGCFKKQLKCSSLCSCSVVACQNQGTVLEENKGSDDEADQNDSDD